MNIVQGSSVQWQYINNNIGIIIFYIYEVEQQNSVDRLCLVKGWGLFLSIQQSDCLGKEAVFVSAGFGKQCPVSPTREKKVVNRTVCDQDVRGLQRFSLLFS